MMVQEDTISQNTRKKLSLQAKCFKLVFDLPTRSSECFVDIVDYAHYLECKLNWMEQDSNLLLGMNWAFMIHDQDMNECNFVAPHIHCFIQTDSRHTLSAVLNYLVKYLDVNSESISIQKSHDVIKDVRYLCHLDSPSKHLYDILDVVTNKRFHNVCFEYLSMDFCNDLSYNDLKLICDTCANKKSWIMSRLGLKAYQKYRWCIYDIIDDVVQDKIAEKNLNKRIKQNEED